MRPARKLARASPSQLQTLSYLLPCECAPRGRADVVVRATRELEKIHHVDGNARELAIREPVGDLLFAVGQAWLAIRHDMRVWPRTISVAFHTLYAHARYRPGGGINGDDELAQSPRLIVRCVEDERECPYVEHSSLHIDDMHALIRAQHVEFLWRVIQPFTSPRA